LLPVRKIEEPNSLDIFRMQEVERFNALIVMSIQLENMFLAFLDKKVPEIWENAA